MAEGGTFTATRTRRVRFAGSLLFLIAASIPALAAKQELTPLEREVQGWLKAHPASPTVPVALEVAQNRGVLVPNLYLRIDVTPSGDVTHVGRTIVGQVVKVNRWDLLDPRSTPRIQFLGFDIKGTEASFRLLVTGRVGWTGVHVHFPRGTIPGADDLIIGLARVADFGADIDRLRELRDDFESLERRIEARRGDLASASSARERQSASEHLIALLGEAVENRRSRAALLNVASSQEAQFTAEISEMEASVRQLTQEVIAELDAEWRDQRARLSSAEAAFRARPLKLERQLEAAQGLATLVLAASENRLQLAERSPDGGGRSTLQAFNSSLENWRKGAERALARGCQWEEPLSEAKIVSLLEGSAPDFAHATDLMLAGEIRSCGTSFRLEPAVLARFEQRGVGTAARAAFRDTGVFRLARDQVPELESALASLDSSPFAGGSPLLSEASPSTATGDGQAGRPSLSTTSGSKAGLSPPQSQEDWRSRRESDSARRTPSRQSATQNSSGRVHLRVAPLDASVYVDGEFIGTGEEVSQLQAGLLVDAGMRRFEFVRPGYRSQARSLNVASGEELTLRVELARN